MSEENKPNENNTIIKSAEPVVDKELEALKLKAKTIGMKYHPSIKAESLSTKIEEFLKEKEKEEKKKAKLMQKHQTVQAVPQRKAPKISKEEIIRRRATQLVRVRVTCMNPAKKDWDGEIFNVRNRYTGPVKKYVPFNNNEGWHIPRIIYNYMKNKKCQVFYTVKDKFGNTSKKAKNINEFSMEELPPLTNAQLKELAQRQAMASGTQEESAA